MKVKVRGADEGCGLSFVLEMRPDGTDRDKRVMKFFDKKVRPIAEQQHSDKIGRSFLYAYAITISSHIEIRFAEQVEHMATLKNGRKAKVIEIEV